MILRDKKLIKKGLKTEKVKLEQEIDQKERIRTYNFPQGRVTDHRINLTLHKLEEFMEGEVFDEMIENLSLQAQEQEIKNLD